MPRALGEAKTLDEVPGARKEVTEGVFSAGAVATLARRLGIALPVCFAVDALFNHGASVGATVGRLTAAFARR